MNDAVKPSYQESDLSESLPKETHTLVDVSPIILFYEYGSIKHPVIVEQFEVESLYPHNTPEGVIWMLKTTRNNLMYPGWVPADTLIWGIPRSFTDGNKKADWKCLKTTSYC